ncbi:hypothetical protein [Palleronia abyssalis]|uniref:Type I secretion protein n=1 Tax=Palleronia abyssalis TaxID=1501240 RepID=A0A2R8C0P4_9RHOB|nr:hypothetical protein [Palleronia abyssalis]SPJ25978.1 hypothetical protein PAA8504_03834 [Palleronia abyssalis]
MQMDDVGDQIERFAGYLRILDEEGRVTPVLEGEATVQVIDLAGLPSQALPYVFADAVPQVLVPGRESLPAPGTGDLPRIVGEQSAFWAPMRLWADLWERDPGVPLREGAPLFPVWSQDVAITIEYFHVGSQLIVIRQANILEDGDTVLANPDAGRPDWGDPESGARIAALLEEADLPETPAGLEALQASVGDPAAFPGALREVLDAQLEDGDGWVQAFAVEGEGVWVDGVLMAEAPLRPDFTSRDAADDADAAPGATPGMPAATPGDPIGGGDAAVPAAGDAGANPAGDLEVDGRNGLERPGLEAELGGNIAMSTAVIRDLNDVGGTLVVMGDVQDLSVIWQTNLLSDLDTAHLAGEVDAFAAGANTLHNIARFETAPSMLAAEVQSAIPWSPYWSVDVVEGNLVDFNMLVQKTVIHDGDVSVQHVETGFQRLVLGNNDSTAIADLMVLRDYYDAILVGGDMIRANMIFQLNALVDDDALRVIGAEGSEEPAMAGGGENTVWNEALIQRLGTDTFTPVTDGARAFHDALARGDETADAWPDLPVPGGGGVPLRILFVEGDYWDVNAISQVNEIHDADAALQMGPGQLSLMTGANTAANIAQIIDFRGQGDVAMIGGTHYDDEMMIQTNLLAEDATVRIIDPHTLASEVIAFLDPDLLVDTDGDGVFDAIMLNMGDDMMSGVMA